jgi:hypothetical protein
MRTEDGYSKTVSAGDGMFAFLGLMGIYTVLGGSIPVSDLAGN